jgi:hypothetical protein
MGNCATHTLITVPFRGGNRMLIFDIAWGEVRFLGAG